MPFSHRTGYVNPRLGTYFGIFMSAFVALTLLVLILEGLGVSDSTLRLAMFLGPIAFYAIIGLAAYSSEPIDYFAAGRRVPAFYTGLVLAQTALGATGLVALTGAFFLIGFDALCIVIGGLAGFVVMAVLLAPFFRKFGAF
nr:sodium:solute symporter [Hyphomicrobium zavarzinii]